METFDQLRELLWGSSYVQANPAKSYKDAHNQEYLAIAQYFSGGSRPDTTSYTKLGRVLVGLEDRRRLEDEHTPEPTYMPKAIQGKNYKLVFEDHFTDLNTTTWRLGNFYTAESPSHYSQSGSRVQIKVFKGETTQRDLQTRTLGFREGYIEARFKYTAHTDAWASLWMMSKNWTNGGYATTDCQTLKVCEYDILEANHIYETPTTFKSHFGTMHSNTASKCGMADAVGPWAKNWTLDTGMVVAGVDRTFGGLWTGSTLGWYLDDKLLKEQPAPATFNQPMSILLGMWSHAIGNKQPAPVDLTLDVDYVRVWQPA